LNITYVRYCLHGMLALLWAPSVLAASVLVIDGTVSVPVALVAIAADGISLSGATALVQRIDRELRENEGRPLPRPWLFCAAHMLGSWLAGTLAFIASQHPALDVWFKLGMVIVASFAGAKFIEAMTEKYLGGLPGATEAKP